MARTRKLPKDFLDDPVLSALPMDACWFYAAMFNHFDAVGVLLHDDSYLSKIIFPLRRDVTPKKVQKWVAALLKVGKLQRVVQEKNAFLFCPEFVDTQHIFKNEFVKYEIPLEILQRLAPKVAAKLQQRSTLTSGFRLLTLDSKLLTPNDAPGGAPSGGEDWATPPKKWEPPKEVGTREEISAIIESEIAENLNRLKTGDILPGTDKVVVEPGHVIDNTDGKILDHKTGEPLSGFHTLHNI